VTGPAELPQTVARTADVLGLHASAPTMLLELSALVGWLNGVAHEATERGRRPFRANPTWESALGAVGFVLYNLADQTGVDLGAAVTRHANQLAASAQTARHADESSWPVADGQ
jgi:hypothetical protein